MVSVMVFSEFCFTLAICVIIYKNNDKNCLTAKLLD